MSIIPKLERLVEWVEYLSVLGDTALPKYRPGLQRDHVVEVLEAAGVKPPPDLVELYTWADGGSYVDLSMASFLSLERALDHFASWHPDFGRPRNWFPIAQSDYFHIYLNLDTSALHSHIHEDGRSHKLADRYNDYLDALIEAFEADGVRWVHEDDDEDKPNTIAFGAGVWDEIAERRSVTDPW